MRKLMKNIFLLLAAIALFSSCEEIIEMDVPETDPVLVIESSISNDTAPFRVQLTMSQPYFDQDERNFISDALVTITGSNGTVDTLLYQDTGLYATPVDRWCVVGETYTLKVIHDGKTYTATEKCKYQDPIDFLMSFYLPDRNGFIEPGYYVFQKSGESEADGDYYQWKLFRNDTILDDFGYILDEDEFRETSFFNINIDPDDPLKDMDRNILPRPFPFEFEVGDTVRVEQYNISKAYYDFLIELETQISRSGTPFDPPPVNPNFNIRGGAIGFFSVTNLTQASIVVEE